MLTFKGKNGEDEITNMESFSDLALSKTYNIDAQTADSAGTGKHFFVYIQIVLYFVIYFIFFKAQHICVGSKLELD